MDDKTPEKKEDCWVSEKGVIRELNDLHKRDRVIDKLSAQAAFQRHLQRI